MEGHRGPTSNDSPLELKDKSFMKWVWKLVVDHQVCRLCPFRVDIVHLALTFDILGMLCSVNLDLYKVLVKELAQTLELQLASNPEVRAAGIVINTMGWVDGVGYEVTSLTIAANTFCFVVPAKLLVS